MIAEYCPGAIMEGNALHDTQHALHIAVEFGQIGSHEGRFSAQLLFILSHDWFDEDLVESCASIGNSLEEAMKACTQEFSECVLKSVLTALDQKESETITADLMGKKYLFHVPPMRTAMHKGKCPPADLWNAVQDKIPEYLGTKRVYWIKLYSADMGNRQFCEARINGTVFPDLTDLLYQEIFRRKDRQISIDKLFLVFIQDHSTYRKCPFTKQDVGELTFMTLDRLLEITDDDSHRKILPEIMKFCPDSSIYTELTVFLPEIAAQKLIDFRDNDALMPVVNYGKPEYELKKSQVRSFGYMEDAFEQYLRKRQPSRDELMNLIRQSGKFEVMTRAIQDEAIKIQDLRMSQLVYFVDQNYHVW